MEGTDLSVAKQENHTIAVSHSEGIESVPFLDFTGTKTIVE
jgi:hypothetical protein